MKLEFIEVGRIVNAHGIRGDVRVQPMGQAPDFLTQFKTFYLGGSPIAPTANRVHKSLVLMKFPGVDDMDTALSFKGKILSIRRTDAKLSGDEAFDDELVGLTVKNAETGEVLGELKEVLDYPAHKIYAVRGTREYLIPAVPGAFIQSVDLESSVMLIHVWEGLASDEN